MKISLRIDRHDPVEISLGMNCWATISDCGQGFDFATASGLFSIGECKGGIVVLRDGRMIWDSVSEHDKDENSEAKLRADLVQAKKSMQLARLEVDQLTLDLRSIRDLMQGAIRDAVPQHTEGEQPIALVVKAAEMVRQIGAQMQKVAILGGGK